MKMISFCNKKGGVGKTTLASNIAYKFSLDNKKVLLIDLDPQANLTTDFLSVDEKLEYSIIDLIATKQILKLMPIEKIILKSKYKNINIIPANKDLNKSGLTIGVNYENSEKYIIADMIYELNKKVLDSYDYVIIDYPPTINELSLNFLILSDLIIIPANEALRSFKGILDLKDNVFQICKQENRSVPDLKIVFNNIKNNTNLLAIKKWMVSEKIDNYLSPVEIKTSDIFKTLENTLNNVWTNSNYWRQKQAYEQLINEIK